MRALITSYQTTAYWIWFVEQSTHHPQNSHILWKIQTCAENTLEQKVVFQTTAPSHLLGCPRLLLEWRLCCHSKMKPTVVGISKSAATLWMKTYQMICLGPKSHHQLLIVGFLLSQSASSNFSSSSMSESEYTSGGGSTSITRNLRDGSRWFHGILLQIWLLSHRTNGPMDCRVIGAIQVFGCC